MKLVVGAGWKVNWMEVELAKPFGDKAIVDYLVQAERAKSGDREQQR